MDRKFLLEVSLKLTAAKVSLELVLENLQAAGQIDEADAESLRLVFESVCDAGDKVQERRGSFETIQAHERPKLATEFRKSALVVDEDEDFRMSACGYLRDIGYIVFDTGSGADALELVKNAEVDIVVADLYMRDSQGRQLAHSIRDLSGPQPILCLVSTDSHSLKIAQKQVDVDGVLTKPFTQTSFIKEVSRAQTNRTFGSVVVVRAVA